MAGLAVAEAFTVESYYEGTCYSYLISLRDGIPVTLHLGDAPTTERNGLKLGVSVDKNSFSYYREKANSLYKYFDYKPNINDETIILDLEIEERISDDWFIQKSTDRYDYDNYVVMSQVIYQIPRNSAINTHDFRRLVLRAPAGSVTFNPGRESLSLDKKTIDYVNKAFDKVKEDYVNAATTALAACDTDQELVRCHSNLTQNAPNKIAANIDAKPFMSKELQKLVHKCYGSRYEVAMSDEFKVDTIEELQLYIKHSYYKTAKLFNTYNSLGIIPFFEAKHVIIDLKTKFKSALNNYYQGEVAIFWQRTKGEELDSAIEHAKRYLDAIGIKYVFASDIVSKTPVGTTQSREGFYASNIGQTGKVYQSGAMPEEEMKKSKYLYLPLKHTTPELRNQDMTLTDYLVLYRYLQHVKEEDQPSIKGVAKKYQDFVADLDNWVDFEDYIQTEIQQLHFHHDSSTVSISGRMSRNLDNNTIKNYPEMIQQYYKNVQEYNKFCADNTYVRDEGVKNLLLKFKATGIPFTPLYNITRTDLKKRFPLAVKQLLGEIYNAQFDAAELLHLTKVEDFYAIHSADE